MKNIHDRVLDEANLLLEKEYTVRQLAHIKHLSKSTIHKDLTDRLYKIDKIKYLKVKAILDYHTKIRHIRGGESTRRKYLKTGNNNNRQ